MTTGKRKVVDASLSQPSPKKRCNDLDDVSRRLDEQHQILLQQKQKQKQRQKQRSVSVSMSSSSVNPIVIDGGDSDITRKMMGIMTQVRDCTRLYDKYMGSIEEYGVEFRDYTEFTLTSRELTIIKNLSFIKDDTNSLVKLKLGCSCMQTDCTKIHDVTLLKFLSFTELHELTLTHDDLRKLLYRSVFALKVCTQALSFEPGKYILDKTTNKWIKT